MRHEISFATQSFRDKMLVHARIGELRIMQLDAAIGGYDSTWLKEEIADLNKTLKEWNK